MDKQIESSSELESDTCQIQISIDKLNDFITVKFYFDTYELYYGDGFFPVTKKCDACNKEIFISFKLDYEMFWRQTISNDIQGISGLDGDEGDFLLQLLNKTAVKNNKESGVGIKSKYGIIIHPKQNIFN